MQTEQLVYRAQGAKAANEHKLPIDCPYQFNSYAGREWHIGYKVKSEWSVKRFGEAYPKECRI